MKIKIVIPSSKEIAQKGNGRILVQTKDEVSKVENIIKEIDKGEFEGYYPKGFVTLFDKNSNDLIYTHKFDINVDLLIEKCREVDIYIIVYSCNDYHYDDMLTLEAAIQGDLGGGRFLGDFVYGKTIDW